MANKQSKSRRRDGLLDGIEHMTQAELERDLGFDGLTLEACILGLFGELIEDLPGYPGPPGPEPAEEADGPKVTQMGPGRRTAKGNDDASTT